MPKVAEDKVRIQTQAVWALQYMLLTSHHRWFCALFNKPKAEYLSYYCYSLLTYSQRVSKPTFKIMTFKNLPQSLPQRMMELPLFQREKVTNPWPTSGSNPRQSQSPSLKLSESIRTENHTLKNTKDPGSKK